MTFERASLDDFNSIPAPAEPEREPATHTWQPVELSAALEPPSPPTISGLVYPGLRHTFSGESENLKSFAAKVIATEQVIAGNTVLWIDLEMGRRAIRERLLALGLVDKQIDQHFLYLEPQEPLNGVSREDLDVLLYERKPTLVVVDAYTAALSLFGLDPNIGKDIQTFQRLLVDPLRQYGAAVVVIDHLPKSKDRAARYSIGSERKLAVVDVHLGFEMIQPFGRGKTGRAKIIGHKDRPGHLGRGKIAELELVSDPAGGGITWSLQRTEPDDADGAFRPTFLMERVSRYLEPLTAPVSRTNVETNVTGKAVWIRQAIDCLIDEGYASGDGRGSSITSLKPFRETA